MAVMRADGFSDSSMRDRSLPRHRIRTTPRASTLDGEGISDESRRRSRFDQPKGFRDRLVPETPTGLEHRPATRRAPSTRWRASRTLRPSRWSAPVRAPRAARPLDAPPWSPARIAWMRAHPCAPLAANMCVYTATPRAFRRGHRAPLDPKRSETLRKATSENGLAREQRLATRMPSQTCEPLDPRIARPNADIRLSRPPPQTVQPSFMGLRKSQALPRCAPPQNLSFVSRVVTRHASRVPTRKRFLRAVRSRAIRERSKGTLFLFQSPFGVLTRDFPSPSHRPSSERALPTSTPRPPGVGSARRPSPPPRLLPARATRRPLRRAHPTPAAPST